MKDDLDLIFRRRSIRKYTDQEVSDDMIKYLLQAAMSAPSAVNQQPWHFFVIKNRKVLNELAEIHMGFHNLRGAPLAILVCGEPEAARFDFYWQQDCSAATQNILLAATALGLGAVWQGINPRGGSDSDAIRSITNLPMSLTPFSLISIGHPAEFPAPSNRYNEAKVHYIK